MVGDVLAVINAGGGIAVTLLVAFAIQKGILKIKSEFDAMEQRALRAEERSAVWEHRFFELIGVADRQTSNTSQLVAMVRKPPFDEQRIIELINRVARTSEREPEG